MAPVDGVRAVAEVVGGHPLLAESPGPWTSSTPCWGNGREATAGHAGRQHKGLWPNVGRVVYVDRFVDRWDFSALGLGHCSGWRVRSWSAAPLETTDGTRMAGFTPQGSLSHWTRFHRSKPRAVARDMALADFNEAMADLAEILRRQEPQQMPNCIAQAAP